MKNSKIVRVLLGCLAGLILFGLGLVAEIGKTQKTYPTPEAALTSGFFNRNVKIEHVMENNGVALVYSYKDPSEVPRDIVVKDQKGWHKVTGTPGLIAMEKEGEVYRLWQMTWNGKTFFIIDNAVKVDKNALQVSDSESSEFTFYNHDSLGVYFETWLICLDDLPEGYWISINGDKIRI